MSHFLNMFGIIVISSFWIILLGFMTAVLACIHYSKYSKVFGATLWIISLMLIFITLDFQSETIKSLFTIHSVYLASDDSLINFFAALFGFIIGGEFIFPYKAQYT